MEGGAEDEEWKSEEKEAREKLTCERTKRSRQKEAGRRGYITPSGREGRI